MMQVETKQTPRETSKVYYTYNKIDHTCRSSASFIKRSFNPDVILAIGGGGLIPARILRTDLNVPIYVVSLSTYCEDNTPIKIPRVVQWMDFADLRGKKILIVDEVDDTRKTLGFLTDKLVNEEGILKKNLGVFVIHNKIKKKQVDLSNLNIHYYTPGEEVEDKWIVYPWD